MSVVINILIKISQSVLFLLLLFTFKERMKA